MDTEKDMLLDTESVTPAEGIEVQEIELEPVNEVVEEVNGVQKRYEAMKQAVKEFTATGTKVCPLERPILVRGENLKSLMLDFNKLTAMDMIEAESRWVMEFGGSINVSASHSTAYRLIIASKASGVLLEDLLDSKSGLHYRDVIGISNVVLNFLMQLD